MIDYSFLIYFPKFDAQAKKVTFFQGLNIVYGESGVGKTSFGRKILGYQYSANRSNFDVSIDHWFKNSTLVLQNPDDQIVAPSINKELAFNLENRGIESKKIQSEIENILKELDLKWDLKRHPSTLSGGEKQILNLITAISSKPELVVIDDALSFLSKDNKEKMIEFIKNYCLNHKSVAVWLTSDFSDLVFSENTWELKLDSIANCPSFEKKSINRENIPNGRAILRLDNFSFSYNSQISLFNKQSLTVGTFRSLAILGENGSGKSTLGHLISGLLQPDAGDITLVLPPKNEIRIGYLQQFPERMAGGYNFSDIVEEMVKSSLIKENNIPLFVNVLQEFQISWDLVMKQPIYSLKLSVARIVFLLLVCYANYDVVVLDEPTFSLGAKQQYLLTKCIKNVLLRKHMIIISHNDVFTRNICDKVIEISKGEIQYLTSNKKIYV